MSHTYTDATIPLSPIASLIGTWRRFGIVGPVYEIVGTGDKLQDGGCLMRVRVVESGEELDYPLSDILDDPKER